jgi:hypothetical protein
VTPDTAGLGVPVADPGNRLLMPVPAELFTAILDGPDGSQKMALTIRTASTTLTVLLAAAAARVWGSRITAEAGNMSGNAATATTISHAGGNNR